MPKIKEENEKLIYYRGNSKKPKSFSEKDVDGVMVKIGHYGDGSTSVYSCEFDKSQFDKDTAGHWIEEYDVENSELHTVRGVEIFSTGEWNGRKITEQDLENIVEAFSETREKLRPFLKLGHDDNQKLLQQDGFPAAGWVENIRKVGKKLVADFVDIPKKIFKLIKNKAYRKVSIEVFNNVNIEGKKFPKMLGAVALLGSDMPAVMNLNDILSMYSLGFSTAQAQKFALPETVDIISRESEDKSGDHKMDEYKEKFAKLEKSLENLQTQVKEKDAEIEKYKRDAEESRKRAEEAAKKQREADVDAFCASLESENLASKSMIPFVQELLLEDKEKYSIDKREYTKPEALKELLKFATELGKVNFGDKTKDGNDGGKDGDEDLHVKVEKYAKEKNVTYGAAYRAITRDLDLAAEPMSN